MSMRESGAGGARKGKVHEKELNGCDFSPSECLLHTWDSRILVGLVKFWLNNSQYTFTFLSFPLLRRGEEEEEAEAEAAATLIVVR
ncbi:hypothetical protein VNO78_14817 [Psophocarpus tetragonolobus]|uniref:Uncharacterized protein n=1 Tax=Psophocarpus tetragonolobus TaxID=3891 RepID=A0AAN9SDW9_PSOTE